MSAPVTGAATRERFVAERPYPLDRFQLEALDILDDGQSVLVSRPDRARARQSSPSTPLHWRSPRVPGVLHDAAQGALEPEVRGLLRKRYGADRVGLLTGDNSINGQAPIVVMTTEVLRNMIYAEPGRLADLRCVVLDEVHYLEDRYRERGLGRGHPPAPLERDARLPVGDGLRTRTSWRRGSPGFAVRPAS